MNRSQQLSVLLGFMASLIAGIAVAQHEGHPPAATPTPAPGASSAPVTTPPPAGPDSMTAMEGIEPTDHWMTMVHSYAFLTVNRQGGPSGDREFESQNHLMLMSVRRLWGGKLSVLGTFTLEPATTPPEGTAELFQSGETYHGVLLVDRQHPHDLFVQLGASWERTLSPDVTLRLYLAPVGEPALGPVAYPHRLSASENPTAPLSHHNQDSTHISSDVITLGVTAGLLTLEGSVFHGEEPDENRWDIDQGKLDSYSGRITLRPAEGFSFQFSSGYRKHPEALEPGNQTRTTASLSYQAGGSSRFFAATLASGLNQTDDGREWGHLFEWTWKFADKNFFYGRVESVDRDFYELVHKQQRPEGVEPDRVAVQAATLGFARNLAWPSEAELAAGADVTLYRFPSRLDSVYGGSPASVHGFLRLRFGSHTGGLTGHTHPM
jgi:hypothetical protein